MPQGHEYAEKTHIGEHDYTMRMMPPKLAYRLLFKVGKVLGPPLVAAIAETDGGKGNLRSISKLGEMLFMNLEYEMVEELMSALAPYSDVDGKPLDKVFDLHFTGKVGQMTRWLAWGMGVQWYDFLYAFPTLGAIIAQQLQEMSSAMTDSPEATKEAA